MFQRLKIWMNEPAATLRKRLEQHRNNPSCLNCHKKIDPVALPWRTTTQLVNGVLMRWWRRMRLCNQRHSNRGKRSIFACQQVGANTDFIAILPAGVKDEESYKQPGLYKGSPIWKYTTNTEQPVANGVFSGAVSLTAPNQPGEYEYDSTLTGNDNIPHARQTLP